MPFGGRPPQQRSCAAARAGSRLWCWNAARPRPGPGVAAARPELAHLDLAERPLLALRTGRVPAPLGAWVADRRPSLVEVWCGRRLLAPQLGTDDLFGERCRFTLR